MTARRLVFRNGEEFFALPLDYVLEVVGRTPYQKVKDGLPFVQIRSQDIPCLPAPCEITGMTSVVLQTQRGIGALVVNAVTGIFRSSDCKFHLPPLSLSSEELARVVQVLEIDDGRIRATELNIEKMIEQLAPDFLGVAELNSQGRGNDNMATTRSQMLLEIPMDQSSVALAVSDVERIIPYRNPTPISGLPDFALGLINVEGSIIPLLDLQKRLFTPTEKANTRIVVIRALGTKWGLGVPRISNMIHSKFDDSKTLEHPFGKTLGRSGLPSLTLLDPSLVVNF